MGWGLLAAVLLVAGGFLALKQWQAGDAALAGASTQRVEAAPRGGARDRRASAAGVALSLEEAMRMRSTDWRGYLASHASEVDPQLSNEIIELSIEFDEAIAAGLSPRSVEAQTYAEAMLALLESVPLDE